MTATAKSKSTRPIAIWLIVGVGMIVIQILLGGVTRLTGSGLSITEWNVVTGAMPPVSETKWMEEFEKYRQTPQFHLLNSDFTLKEFKFIFFWEWFHRFWARLIGVVFIIPFIIFLIQRRFRPEMVKPMLILFLLGALQGAIGWIMVASGLEGDAIYVKPTKLALHFIFALGLLCYTYWFALDLMVGRSKLIDNKPARKMLFVILPVFILQLIYGAFMAGHKAATAAPTWPDINGTFLPAGMGQSRGGLSLVDNPIMIHFIHRGLAYILLALVLILTIRLYRIHGSRFYQRAKRWPMILILLQAALGILSVLKSVTIVPNHWGMFEWLAEAHQLVAMLLLISLATMLFLCRPGRLSKV